jgi:N-hydroxyarylamine O-acetyltransferase
VVANHYVSTLAASRFVGNFLLGRTRGEGRLGLINYYYTERRTGQEPVRRRLHDVAELRAVMEGEFLLRLPVDADFDRRLEELPRG